MREQGLERTILLQDVAVVLASLVLAGVVRAQLLPLVAGLRPVVPAHVYLHLTLIFVPAWALCAERLELNRTRVVTGVATDLLRRLFWTQVLGLVVIAVILFLAQVGLNRSLIAIFLVLSTLLLVLTKLAQRQWILSHYGQALALIVGRREGRSEDDIEWVRGRRLEALEDVSSAALQARLHAGGVDEVILPGWLPRQELKPLLEACAQVGVPALVSMDRVDLGLVPPRAEVIGRTLYLSYRSYDPGLPSRFVKAVLDRTLAAVLLVLCAPLLIAVAVLIRVLDGPPVLFVQPRGGLNGRSFRMLKFRTMNVGAEQERDALLAVNEMDGPVFKIAEDPRVTRLGRFLRRTSIDELPQLVNVLVGDMSLVGPRPLPLVETGQLTGMHRRRLSVRPGITCLWQISGRNKLSFQDWMTLDLEYIDHWSLALDAAILLRTIPALLSRRGAS